ncbi:MFS transporter [Shewanella sp. 10N.286.51.B8]|uniref:MFS transporter n=2 Tax=Shewanella TaxID=22 RepID=UPI000C814C1F|nr:MFS transporter [Shewanella sp. 10N.286.48.A6]
MQKSQYANVTRFSMIAAFGGFIFGLDAANISGALRFISAQFGLDAIQQGTVVGCALLGVIVALFFTGTLCERFGRAKVLLAIGLTYSLSSIVSASAISYEMLVVGRFIGGVAFASITVSAMYIGEIAPAETRGKFVSVNQFMIGLGLLLAFVINYFLIEFMDSVAFLDHHNVWRFMLGAELIANIIWVALLMTLPESPRWLVKKQRTDEARVVFARISPPEQVEPLLLQVNKSFSEQTSQDTVSQLKILFSKRLRFVLLLATAYAVVQGATGMNAVLFFAPMVFEQVGMSVEDTFLQTTVIGVVGLVSTFIAIGFVEKLGRRTLTLAGLVLVVIAHSSTYYGFSQASYQFSSDAIEQISAALAKEDIDSKVLVKLKGQHFDSDVALKSALADLFTPSELPLVTGPIINATQQGINAGAVLFGIFAFLAAFNLSIGPIMWVVFSEIFPNSVRSVALPFAALVQTVSSWSIQQFFPWQLDNMGVASIFALYAMIGLIGTVVMYFTLPETKGKTIEAIEMDLAKA